MHSLVREPHSYPKYSKNKKVVRPWKRAVYVRTNNLLKKLPTEVIITHTHILIHSCCSWWAPLAATPIKYYKAFPISSSNHMTSGLGNYTTSRTPIRSVWNILWHVLLLVDRCQSSSSSQWQCPGLLWIDPASQLLESVVLLQDMVVIEAGRMAGSLLV